MGWYSSSDEEENQLPMSGRKGDDENLKEKEKKINEDKDIWRRKCRTKIPIDKYNEEVRGWTSSSKNPELPPDNNKTKEENRREKAKRKKERAALEWDDLDMQAELKSFMYIDRSLRKKMMGWWMN